jgi:putative transposase
VVVCRAMRRARGLPKKGHSEEQILRALRQAEAGTKVSETCREYGISDATFYIWKKKFSGLGLTELRELRQLREENGKLKRLVADLSLDGTSCRRSCKTAVKPRQRRALGQWTQAVFALSGRRAAGLVKITRKTLVYRSRRPPQDGLRMRLREVAASRVRFGYRRLTVILRRKGWRVNPKRVYRLKEDGLSVRTKVRKKLERRSRVATPKATRPNQKWSMDFMSAKLLEGRWFRVLTVIDQFTRECLALVADNALNGHKVALALSQVVAERGSRNR